MKRLVGDFFISLLVKTTMITMLLPTMPATSITRNRTAMSTLVKWSFEEESAMVDEEFGKVRKALEVVGGKDVLENMKRKASRERLVTL